MTAVEVGHLFIIITDGMTVPPTVQSREREVPQPPASKKTPYELFEVHPRTGTMKALPAFLAGLRIASAFLLPQVPGPGPAYCSSPTSNTPNEDVVHFRPALREEQGAIRRILAGMLMNPLSIDVQNFICAEDKGELVGFGQVKGLRYMWSALLSVYCCRA